MHTIENEWRKMAQTNASKSSSIIRKMSRPLLSDTGPLTPLVYVEKSDEDFEKDLKAALLNASATRALNLHTGR